MEKMGLNEIREKFLSFFESKGCLRLGSFPLIPKDDNSLLLINSGMAPMKAWFTGAKTPPKKRVTTCQKCIRTPDIERVGKTARHGTFFEMLGNFSFGDYFKHEAINWAWEFITEVMQIPKEVLWITVYEDDDEARDIWINEVGVDPERVVKMGKEDNFWEHGTGPCGPCSEIHVDRGEQYSCGPNCKIGCDCDRFMEIWNLVFTQFDKQEDGTYERLANPNIDTGMGLERLAAYKQGVANLFEVDTVQGVMKHICKIANTEYKKDDKTDVSLRVITDHIRSTVMMISDGVIPSNEGRGYVLRRLLRRAARHGKLLNISGEFLNEVADTVINESETAYPELAEKRDYIKNIVKIEEERFDATIDKGLAVLEEYLENSKEITGEQAFKLHDTYGFPLDLTIEIAEEKGIKVDTDGFDAAMKNQKMTARTSRKDGSSWEAEDELKFENAEKTVFDGYSTLEETSKITGLAKDSEISDSLKKGDKGVIVTEKTPFYAEMGGQVGDIGKITSDGAIAKVVDTKKSADGHFMHEVEVEDGEFKIGGSVTLKVCRKNRMAIGRNHSATHLLHKALKEELGTHVAQAGSLVTPNHLRFDFSHFEAMTKEQLKNVEKKVNEKILESLPIVTKEMPIEEAKKLGAAAQFGEKYGDTVRVVSMGDYSVEFCGGTHLENTAQIGLFKLISESGVAAGVRRIEAVTGAGVLEYIEKKDKLIEDTAQAMKSNPNDIAERAAALVNEAKELSRELESAKAGKAVSLAQDLIKTAENINGINVITAKIDGMEADDLRTLGDSLKDKEPNLVLVLAGVNGDKATLVAMATKEAVAKGANAGKIIKEVAKTAGGGGGGKPDSAQAGAKDLSKLDEALALVKTLI